METTQLEDLEKLTRATDSPDVDALIREYQRSTPIYDRYHRIIHADDIRLNRWANKSADGKKHSSEEEEAFPFDGAADSENYLADDTINELVAICVVSFWRAVIQRVYGVEAGDYEQAAHLTKLMEWLMQSKLAKTLAREVELSAQYFLTYGHVVLHPTWERRLGRRRHRIKMQELASAAEELEEGDPIRVLVNAILEPEREAEAVSLMADLQRQVVSVYFRTMLGEHEEELLENYQISDKRIRALVRELREDGEGEIPVPVFTKNEPCVTTLKVGEEVFVPHYMTDVQDSVVFVRQFMSLPTLEARATLEGWDPEWVSKAKGKVGMQSNWIPDQDYDATTDSAWEFSWQDQSTTQHDMIEVLYAYHWRLDEDDIMQRYFTILHADISKTDEGRPLFAKHGLVDYDHHQMPFVLGMREWRDRSFRSSRGIPFLLRSRQHQLKTFYDGLIDYQSISVFPPLHVYDAGLGVAYEFGPARRNPVSPGREPKFLEIPTKGVPVAFDLVRVVNGDVSNAFGLMDAEVSPTRVQTKQQMLVNTFLMMWTEALQQVFALMLQYMPESEFRRITGSEKALPRGQDIADAHDFVLQLDVRTLDIEHVLKEFKAIAEAVRPLDQDGVINMGKLVRAMVRAINPSLAKEILMDQEGASQVVYRKVQNDLLLMLGGFDPEYGVDDDPAAGMKVRFVQEIISKNGKLQQAAGNPNQGIEPADPDFADRLMKYLENLQFNLQQQDNKQRGRIGI